MKLENLFALYLYQNKKLNLPGIGVFTADKIIAAPDDSEKHPVNVQGITFTNKNVALPDDDFIDFIKTHTGKMRPLAISDLESYLMLSKQFLNIGKPFYLDGIGTLQKVNDGSLKFIPGEYATTKLEAPVGEKKLAEKNTKSAYVEENREYRTGNNVSRKMLVLLLALGTLLLVGWGGYYLFKSNTGGESISETGIDTLSDTNTMLQSPAALPATDSLQVSSATGSSTTLPSGTYKFVLESAGKKRALKRYNDLQGYGNGIRMETKDSVLFQIFLVKQASPTDTTRLKDSLNAWYYGTKEMKVKIQQ
ncbi:MAG: hypothetical protein H7Y03_15295 [Chitinophagaceae bacterium]|nr:hypothetical protein [Chitinophagaceae bacterium]